MTPSVSNYEAARAAETGTREMIEAHQAEQLPNVLAAVAKSPYWAARFAEADFDPTSIRTPADLVRAPTIDKQAYFSALQRDPDNYGGLLTEPVEEIRKRGAFVYRTTGTSGKQGRFINTNDGFQMFGNQGLELVKAAGGRPGDTVMLTWPLSFWSASWGFYFGSRVAPYLVVPAGPPCDSAMRVALMREYRPAVLVLTPSYAVTLGEAARSAGMHPAEFGVRGLLMGGETFGEKKRALIEELWGIPGGTRNFYGISEGGPLFAVECEAQNGLHLFEGDTIHQFWRPGTNEPAQPGELAEHVFTSISQRTMATWFNFRTKDAATYTDEPCKCGMHTRRMWIAERLDDMVKIKGINVFASGVEDLLSQISGVGREFLLVIDEGSKETLTLQVEIDPALEADVLRSLISKAMQQAWGINFSVECLAPNTLPRTEGKARRWKDLRAKS